MLSNSAPAARVRETICLTGVGVKSAAGALRLLEIGRADVDFVPAVDAFDGFTTTPGSPGTSLAAAGGLGKAAGLDVSGLRSPDT